MLSVQLGLSNDLRCFTAYRVGDVEIGLYLNGDGTLSSVGLAYWPDGVFAAENPRRREAIMATRRKKEAEHAGLH